MPDRSSIASHREGEADLAERVGSTGPADRTQLETDATRNRLPPRGAYNLAVFCDFDGTFSVQDVGSTLARQRLPEKRKNLWARYEQGELTPWEYTCELLDGFALPEEELDEFLHTIDLDPGAQALIDWCARHAARFHVLSDGFSYNLDRLQVIHGVSFEYHSNRLRYVDGRWSISPGAPNPECECGTGTCKRGQIEDWRQSHPESLCVHIGNGRVSDLCGALAADRAYAKGTLAPALAERGAVYQPFETLLDVVRDLDIWIGGASSPSAGD
jgi:2-hydroxy-3-keto-5-methylthiopentenyl-1-phosphate phosphatase